MYMCVHLHDFMCTLFVQMLGRTDGVRSPETEVTGSCELPDAGVRNQTHVLCRSTKYFYT